MRAYAESYVADAQARLGTMLDFSVRGLGLELPGVWQGFLASPVASRLGRGDPAIIVGRSGAELALEVLSAENEPAPLSPALRTAQTVHTGTSQEYWTGWALAYYQWASGLSFAGIDDAVDIREVRALFHPYHEMDIRQFCGEMDRLMDAACPQTALKRRRLRAGLSQSQLAGLADVPLRTLQQYEQRQKDINHARADYLVRLSRALSCSVDDLMDYRFGERISYYVVNLS